MALNQQDIDVGAAPNDGQGDPIRTAFIKCNDNFTQLYSLPNSTPPSTLVGAVGDMPGMYAYDDTYFYYCYAPYDGVSTVWGQLIQSDEAASSISNGLSNVVIAFANANVTVGVTGTSNVGVFSSSGLTVKGALNSNTITTGSLVSGNFTVAGDTISSIGETITITPAGNVINGDVIVNAGFSILGPTTTTESKVFVLSNTAANATVANLSGIQIGSANYASFLYDTGNSHWYATGNITADGYRVNGGNINGGFNATFSNAVSANKLFGNTIEGNLVTVNNVIATRITGNTLAGDGGFISNIQGANVVGTVPFANTANFALNSIGTQNANYANFAGTVTNTSQPNIMSVGALTSLTVIGNATIGNITTSSVTSPGVITAPFIGTAPATLLRGTLSGLSNAQPNITSVGTLTSLDVTNSINAGGDISTLGNLFAGNIIGNVVGTIELALYVTRNVQSNITQLGNLAFLNVTGNISTEKDILIQGNIYGNDSVTANSTIIMRNVYGNVVGSSLYTSLRGTLAVGSNAQPNVTSLGTLVSLSVAGATSTNTLSTLGNVSIGGNLTVAGNISFTGNIQEITGNSGQFFGNNTTGFGALYAGVTAGYANVPNSPFEVATNFDGYSQISNQNINPGAKASGDLVITADNGNDTSNYINLGITSSTWDGSEPNSLGNAVGRTDGYLGMQGGIGNGGNLIIGTTTPGKAVRFVVGGVGNTNVAVAMNGANAISTTTTTGALVVFGGCGITGNLNANLITSVGSIYAPSFNWANGNPVISPSGNLTTAYISSTGNIDTSANINGTGATFSGNVTAAYFNGTATSAQYADLAENYLADETYAPGTVLSHGGSAEVTISLTDADPLVIGIVSSKPAYLMNSNLTGKTVMPIAFTGRVPCRVQGPITRGAMLVSNGDGRARAEANPSIGTVIGKALESFDGDFGVIEIVVGKL